MTNPANAPAKLAANAPKNGPASGGAGHGSLQRTLEQHRASHAQMALDSILGKHDSDKFKKEFKARAMKLPTLILNNGLGATLGFLASKGEGKPDKPETLLVLGLKNWLTTGVVLDMGVIDWGKASDGDLLSRVLKIDSETYRHVTMESLAWLTWLKRFVDAKLGDIDGGDD